MTAEQNEVALSRHNVRKIYKDEGALIEVLRLRQNGKSRPRIRGSRSECLRWSSCEFFYVLGRKRAADATAQVVRTGTTDLVSACMIYGHFRPRRHLMAAAGYRHARAEAFRAWRDLRPPGSMKVRINCDARLSPNTADANETPHPGGCVLKWWASNGLRMQYCISHAAQSAKMHAVHTA